METISTATNLAPYITCITVEVSALEMSEMLLSSTWHSCYAPATHICRKTRKNAGVSILADKETFSTRRATLRCARTTFRIFHFSLNKPEDSATFRYLRCAMTCSAAEGVAAARAAKIDFAGVSTRSSARHKLCSHVRNGTNCIFSERLA